MLFDGSTLLAKDAFVYGGAITLELETYLTDRIVLLANIRERALWGSSLELFTTNSDWESNSLSIKTVPSMTIEEIKAIPICRLSGKEWDMNRQEGRGDEYWYLAPYREERTAVR